MADGLVSVSVVGVINVCFTSTVKTHDIQYTKKQKHQVFLMFNS